MTQPITDYAAFFAGAIKEVQDVEQLKVRETDLLNEERTLEKNLQTKKKAVSDTIAATLKKRNSELAKSYDTEITKLQGQLKKIRAKREKARNQGEKERIAENTAPYVRENRDLSEKLRNLFQTERVPAFCRTRLYYSLYFTHGISEILCLILTLLICFAAIPFGIYFLIPNRKYLYLAVIYIVLLLVFGGIYILIGNSTKNRHIEALRKGRALHSQMAQNRKMMKKIARDIRRDKNESSYHLEKFDDEISRLTQEQDIVIQKKKDALHTFETVTKTILTDEIMSGYKEELDTMEELLRASEEQLKEVRSRLKEETLEVMNLYGSYIGKEFLTTDRLRILESIISSGKASNLSEAVNVYKSGNYTEVKTEPAPDQPDEIERATAAAYASESEMESEAAEIEKTE